jgi:hypothetical protein
MVSTDMLVPSVCVATLACKVFVVSLVLLALKA